MTNSRGQRRRWLARVDGSRYNMVVLRAISPDGVPMLPPTTS